MKRTGQTCLLGALLIVSMAFVLVLGYYGTGPVAAQEAVPTGQGKQPTLTAVQAACATTEPAPLLPLDEEAAARDAAQKALDAYNSKQLDSIPLEIMSIWGQDDWAVVECIRDLSDQPVSGTEGTVLLASRSAGRWTAALPGDSNYSSWLDQIPDRFMSPTTKEELRQLNLVTPDLVEPSIGIYRLPYPDEASVHITQDSDQHGGPIDMWSANNSVVAAMSGQVIGFTDVYSNCCCDSACNDCTNWIRLRHSSGEVSRYLHIAQGSVTVAVGQEVEAGTVIAIQSDIGHSCGGGRDPKKCDGTPADTDPCGIHVHFEVRSSTNAYLKPRICDGQGGWFYPDYGETHVATSCPGNCCCSSRQGVWGASQPDWGFAAGGPAIQSICTGDRSVAEAHADQLEQASAIQPQAVSEGEPGERSPGDHPGSALQAVIQSIETLHREPVEPRRMPPTSETYRVAKSVFGAGGGEKRSAGLIMNGTQGQSTDLSRRESSSYVLVPGYWARWYPVPKVEVYLPVVLKSY